LEKRRRFVRFSVGRTIQAADPVDLHLHTLASDGFWTPEELIAHLADHGFKVAAVCDHDSQRSVPDATRLGDERGITIIPAVEMTTWWNERQWHLLVYGFEPGRIDPEAAAFQSCLDDIAALLKSRAEDAKERIEASGKAMPSFEEVRAGRPLTPFHVLSAGIKDGHYKGLKEAAEGVVALGGNFTADLPLARVVAAAHEAGVLCVMAHPGRADSVGIMTAADLDRMTAEGIVIDGLEAHYRSYSDAQTREYREMAAERGLLISCGSDSHAPNVPVDPRPWQAAWCADLLGRFGIEVEGVSEPAWVAPPAPPVEPEKQEKEATEAKASTDDA
jgi:3',5'-nucleoside bisphosphate phosphatase